MKNELDQSDHYQATTRPRTTDPLYESLRDHNTMRRQVKASKRNPMTPSRRAGQRSEQLRTVAVFLALLVVHIVTWIVALAILD